MEYRAVIFDMDGVIIDSEPMWREAEIEVFSKIGVPMTDELCRTMKGIKIRDVVRHWHSVYQWEYPEIEKVESNIVQKLINLVQTKGMVMPGLIEVFEHLKKQGILIGLATSSLYSIMNAVIDALKIGVYFNAVHSAEDEKEGKPAPDVFLGAAKKLGVLPSECIAIEDSVAGIQSAKAAGMYVIALPEAHEYEMEKYDIADRKIKSLKEIITMQQFKNR